MNGVYLVPANAKKQGLIFGFFTKTDLIIFGCGLGLSFIFLTLLPVTELWGVIITLLPLAITGALVFPIPNYHNVRILLKEIINFYSNRRVYVWRGWCYKYEQRNK